MRQHRLWGSVLLIAALAIAGGCGRGNDPARGEGKDNSVAPQRGEGKDTPAAPQQGESRDSESDQSIQTGGVVAGATVVEVHPDRILVNTVDHGDVVFHLSPETEIWDGLWLSNIPMEVGDDITAVGERRADGSWDIYQLYVNMLNMVGPVSSVKTTPEGLQFRIRTRNIGSVTVKIDPRTAVADYEGRRATFASNPIELHEGQNVRVIGRRLKDGSVLATTLVTN